MDKNLELMNSIFEYLGHYVELRFRTFVEDLLIEDEEIRGVVNAGRGRKFSRRTSSRRLGPGRF